MRTVVTMAVSILLVDSIHAQEAATLKKTSYTFKTVGDVKVQVDVYRPDDDLIRPVVVWIHGGALIMGNRAAVPKNLKDFCRREGYALVSIDYRLAPQVKLPEIIADVEDAFAWIRGDGAGFCKLDAARLVVTGGSAGGYLTLMTGLRIKPKPLALVAFWGYGDVDGDWYTKPSKFYRKQPLVDEKIALAGVGKNVFTGSEPDYDAKGRSQYYLYLRQNGLWTREVAGFDPKTDRAKLDPYCPVRNVTKDFPPTILIHGTEDADVPYGLSAAMAKEFEKHGVAHKLVTVSGAGHGLAGGRKEHIEEAHASAVEFIKRHFSIKK